ncbi:serine type site-specific recombinase [Salinimicrobium marinum]|uniref:Serine type site-specific recombinase n=1 Tax=Salinimicrobium marinum TaxID=680283 RepID=A0A918S5H5_9FLAO|nr:recombinase family protein [Salinimicrobium marinum]GHA25468.1 serine type site-specific recombinase [Salinimicrobium marinum]
MNLDKFKKFKKESTVKITDSNTQKEIWSYTRVSSKEQTKKKYSIEGQIKHIEEYALDNDLVITQRHGGTYESAKRDFTRREFKLLIDNVRSAKKKPHAIAIKFISRFSRSGGSAIGLVEELVETLKVHLIETSSGLTTETEKGQMDIYSKLLHSKKENMMRMEMTLPALKDFVEEGNWLGRPPRGYTMYGEKVTNYKNRIKGQELKINEEGKILKKAWQWKSEGMPDFLIRQRLLDQYHFKMTKQSMSNMWRNPFYVGVSKHRMLDSPIIGKWPALVPEKIWDKVQALLQDAKRQSGYEKSKINEFRPLTGFIHCAQCGAPITSYIAKKKNVHYYKCQHGKGGNMNAFTTPRSLKVGVNDAFIDFLKQFELEDHKAEALKSILSTMLGRHADNNKDQVKNLKLQLKKVQEKIDKVDERYFLSENQNEEAYVKIKGKLESEIEIIKSKIQNVSGDLSNQDNYIEKAIDFSQNLSKHWNSGDLSSKLIIQQTLFPEGLIINPENREYRTKKMNGLISVIESIARDEKDSKSKKATQKGGLSSIVAGTGLEPVTFGL